MDFRDYRITINFAGYVGADNTYSVVAETREEAIEEAIEEAADDLTIENIEYIDDGEYEVTIGFCGYIGVEETYVVSADSEEDAENAAIEEAKWDLSDI